MKPTIRSSLVAAALLIAHETPALAQKSPDEALKALTVAEGLQVELFASEPMFVNPTCIDVDHKGRVWVCESVNYRCDLRKTKRNRAEGDRLVVLEDTDGDGKADKSHTFYQEKDFLAPLGVAVMPYPDGKGQRVYVCHSPHIYVFEDKDGDLKPDAAPKILLTGFKGYDHDHGVHGIHFGPDGKLYFSVGDAGVDKLSSANGNFKDDKVTGGQGDKVKGEPGASAPGGAPKERIWSTNRTDCQAATCWRCNPDGTNLELLAHNFRNPYEPAVDSFGTVFMSDNDDDGNQQTRICYVMYGGNYGYWPRNKGDHHWHEDQPGVVHKVLRTGFGSPTGMCWYEGAMLRDLLVKLRPNPPGPPSRSGKGGEEPPKGNEGATSSPSPLRGGGRGEGLYGLLLHTEAGPREVRCYVVKPKGAGYELDQVNLVTSTDNWFRPSDVCVAPDGSVFVSDWYDPGVGGHGMGDITRGRIYRITPKGHKGYRVPTVDMATPKARRDILASPNLAARYLVSQWLFQHAKELSGKFKDKVIKKPEGDLHILASHQFAEAISNAAGVDEISDAERSHSPWLQARWTEVCAHIAAELGPSTGWLGSFAYESPNPDPQHQFRPRPGDQRSNLKWKPFHLQVIRLNRERYLRWAHLKLADVDIGDHDFVVGEMFSLNLAKPLPQPVAREVLVAIRDLPPEGSKRLFYYLVDHYDGQDPFYLAAINIAVGTDPKRREIILADFEKHFPEWNDRVAKLVWELRPPAVIATLDQKLADPKLTAAQKAFVLNILAVSDGIEPGLAMLKLLQGDASLELRQQALKSLVQYLPSKWSALKKRSELEAAVAKLTRSPATMLQAIDLIAAAELDTGADTLAQWAADRNLDQSVRVAAVRGLSAFKSDGVINFLAKLSDGDPLAKEAIQALGQIKTDRSITPLKAAALDEKRAPALRQEAVAALAASRPGTVWLLEAHGKKELPEALAPDIVRLLRNSPYQDLRNRAMVAFPAPGKLDPKKLPAIATLMKRTGDAAHGREVFLKNKDLGCVRCHSIRGAGGNIGPDLSMIGKKGSRENLFESLLDPDKAVADQYVQWIVLDDKGLTLTGLMVEENATGLVIRDANGKDTKVPAANIDAKKKSPKSIMPSDLVAYMSEHDLLDVVAYLETLKTPALAVDQWHILGPFDNGANDAGLDKEYINETSTSNAAIVHGGFFTFNGKHGDIKWQTVKPNAESYVDLAAFFAPQSKETVSYLYRGIESPAEQEATIMLGADDGCKLWVNGEQVLSHRRHEAATPERDSVKVKLKKGGNWVLLKISNGDGPHGFYFTVLSEQELKGK